ncbi:hypothetical protein [Clostridium faecium]|uniref:Helix-turn-helix domain-containing protein n=1 Tax=Clostridium faecium TaxID=2762223 RepID=A0ABR8YNL2_9CLOT|nr:hypothetical protein [Clostridium faecium]MBD8045838.1 hypothetical protein [Clostridium faecium]
MLDKTKVKELYELGYNSSEISKILGENKETVKKCIQRNFKGSVIKHKDKREELLLEKQKWRNRDCKRAVNATNNRYIGDDQLIRWNRQSYNTSSNGTLVFDASRGAIPGDLPRSYRVCY